MCYCTVGYRSACYVKELLDEGFDAYNLEHSILGWVRLFVFAVCSHFLIDFDCTQQHTCLQILFMLQLAHLLTVLHTSSFDRHTTTTLSYVRTTVGRGEARLMLKVAVADFTSVLSIAASRGMFKSVSILSLFLDLLSST